MSQSRTLFEGGDELVPRLDGLDLWDEADDELHVIAFDHGEYDVLVLDLELPEPPLPELTESERAVALRVAEGASNADVAEERGVSLRTVANQLRSIFTKLGVASRWELGRLLARRSLGASESTEAPTIVTRRPASTAPVTGILNSPATTAMLRATYERHGVSFDATRRRLGIELVGEGALRREDYCDLFEALAGVTGRPTLGLELARSLPTGALGLFEWLALTAPTLGEAMRAVSEYGDLLHDGGRRVTRTRGEQLVVSYWVEGFRPPRAVLDWSFGCLYERARAALPLPPVEVSLQYDDPRDGSEGMLFDCPVYFGAGTNELVLSREVARTPLETSQPAVFAALRGVAERRRECAAPPTPSVRVRAALMRELAAGEVPKASTLARRFGVSERALAETLRRDGTSLAALADQARLDLKVRALEARLASPAEVVAELRRADTER